MRLWQTPLYARVFHQAVITGFWMKPPPGVFSSDMLAWRALKVVSEII
jgi:hypothetical protein